MKRFKLILTLIIFILFINTFAVYANDEDEEFVISESEKNEIIEAANSDIVPTINSRRYVIYDRASGRVVASKEKDKKVAMASTTKIMTILVVLEKCDLQDIVTINSKAAGMGGSVLGINTNDKITVNDLLYGLMLRSGNDAAVALAIHTSGSVEEFAKLMNEKAKQLGLVNTSFVTPHGLDNENHYTTAYELAKLTDYVLNNETVKKIVSTKITTIYINGNPMQISNTNSLLGNVEGVYGVKTGFTNNAGRCLVTAVKRDNMDLIIVTLGADTSKDRAKDSIKLIEYAYKKYRVINIEEIIKKEFEIWKQINQNRIYIYKGANNLELKLDTIKIKEVVTDIEPKVEINSVAYLEAPIEINDRIGTLVVKIGNEILEKIEIQNSIRVEKRNIFDYFNIISKIYTGKISII